jgi:prepilin-type N-terminal cleavage/methylation domain-containing protein
MINSINKDRKMKSSSRHEASGYTLIELIVIMVIVGILAAIAGPSWLGFLNRQRLSVAQSTAVTAIREAQANATRQKRRWAACFQDTGTSVRWAVNPLPANNLTWNCSNATTWQNLGGSDADKIAIDPARSRSIILGEPGNYYRVQFEENGWAGRTQADSSQDLGKITFVTRNQTNGSKRCVFVATLLGAVRTANDTECNN